MAQNNWIDVEFKGLDDAVRTIQKIKTKIETDMERIMLQAAFILEAEVKRQITEKELIDTGTLRASVFSFVTTKFGMIDGVVGTPMEYAPFLEYGTGQSGAESDHPNVPADYNYGDSPGIRAYKYMWTAWINKRDEIIAFIEREFRKLVSVDADVAATFRDFPSI